MAAERAASAARAAAAAARAAAVAAGRMRGCVAGWHSPPAAREWLIASAAAYSGLTAVTFVLLFASAGVMEHSGIKIPYFAFFAHDAGHDVEEAPWNMLLAMGIAAALCIGIGVLVLVWSLSKSC